MCCIALDTKRQLKSYISFDSLKITRSFIIRIPMVCELLVSKHKCPKYKTLIVRGQYVCATFSKFTFALPYVCAIFFNTLCTGRNAGNEIKTTVRKNPLKGTCIRVICTENRFRI